MVLTERLRSLLGPSGWLSSKSEVAPYSRDWLNQYGVPPLGVARPASTQQVAEVMRLCNDACVAVVPQGGRTGLVGASVAVVPETVLLSLSRLDEIEEINPIDFTVTVGAGVILANLHSALEDADLWLPMHLGSEGSAQIGA